MTLSYKIKSPPVVQETIDDEVIIVNLDSGCYYSMDGVGARIWSALARGAGAPEIARELAAQYDASDAELDAAVNELLADLESEGLIVARPADAPTRPAPPPAPGTRQPFTAPVLHKYDDMQDLLVLDPIQEVDETGWPTA